MILLPQIIKRLEDGVIYILTAAVIGALTALLVSVFLLPKTYESQAVLLVYNRRGENSDGQISTDDLMASGMLAQTYETLLASDEVCERVVKRIGFAYAITKADVSRAVTVSQRENTALLTICAVANDRNLAADMANAVALDAISLDYFAEVEIRIVSYAEPADAASAPNHIRSAFCGGIFGAAGFGAVWVIIPLIQDVWSEMRKKKQKS